MSVRILIGDCRARLAELPDASVNCCVTSPPYFGLRDYGTAQWAGGDASCDHLRPVQPRNDRPKGAFNGSRDETDMAREPAFRGTCGKCGATRIDRQMGLEPTPDEFVTGMVEVFREVRRVLRDDGTLWLNIGDSYAGGGRGGNFGAERANWRDIPQRQGQRPGVNGCKAKDLVGIPWMLAFALRADGWYLRQDIIWSKPNPMPESVRDRCTKAHEYLFLLSKGPRYFYDAEAIAEAVAPSTIARLAQDVDAQEGSARVPGKTNGRMKAAPPRFGGSKYGDSDDPRHQTKSGNEYVGGDGTRNKRSVWEVATQPFSEAHFATYPPALIEPCILAGCPAGGTVLDPFGGAGTTGMVADRLQRNAVLIELNPEYAEIARKRLSNDGGMFAEVKAA